MLKTLLDELREWEIPEWFNVEDVKAHITEMIANHEKTPFVLCKAIECFPEHTFNDYEGIHVCSHISIGEANWD